MIYAATIFLSSFLLFLVQPLVARLILPWFGGSAAVWTTCMLFFQALLLAGYAYAHAKERLLLSRRGTIIHVVLLAAAVATLPIAPAESWKPVGLEEPVGYIVRLLVVAVGLPYFLLASTSPLIQAWFSRARPGANPYRLFALSNAASLVALVGYPLVVEPFFSAREQVLGWSWLFAAFAVLCAIVAWRTPAGSRQTTESWGFAGMRAGDVVYWTALSATGSVLLLAVTNHLTQNVAAVPMLWLAPLTLYLLSFIVTFEGRGWYRPQLAWSFVLVWLLGMAWVVADAELHHHLNLQLAMFLSGLFIGCVFCHGELYRLRPPPAQLTAFYLTVSAGGALGGVLVAVLAPLVFNGYYELGVALLALGVLAALRFAALNAVARYASLAVLLAVAGAVTYDLLRFQEDVRVAVRSFYGVLRVKEYGKSGEEGHVRRLMHGTIMHGEQYLHPTWRTRTTSYYTETSGVGIAIDSRERRPLKVGVVGLGAGTVAAWARRGDTYRFYEIDRHVIDVAKTEFAYLADSEAAIELVLGDARLNLEREAPQGFDVLAVDAFSGDAIPVHLITREALGVYLRHMKPDGIVAFHVSNRYLDLIPIVARIAAEHDAHAVLISDDPDENDRRRSRSDWVLVSRSAEALERPQIEAVAKEAEDRPELRTWTDDYSNLIQILQ
ncbi:MAG TPA: fused MFS/spermidine synthase [Burkholderiales bacterium]|nr:fused MFS/spermidine synthase [Burkholderiales bacterium]